MNHPISYHCPQTNQWIQKTVNVDFDLNDGNLAELVTLAASAHHGQVDKLNVDYIHHPVSVANNYFHAFGQNYNGIATALLHDTVEDTELSFEQLRAFVPDEVVTAIGLVTKQGKVDYLEYIDGLIQQNNITAMQVKYCDLKHNTDPNRGSSPLPHKMAIYAQAMEKLAQHLSLA